MTLCIGWIRKVKHIKELCLVSDSCLSNGDRFYAAPKIFTLKRGDCAFACAGSTEYFYPIAEHIVRAIDLNQPVNDRAIDITDLKHSVLDIINKSLLEIRSVMGYNLDEDRGPDFSMLYCGYSWKVNDFKIYQVDYNRRLRKMQAVEVGTTLGQPLGVIGDYDVISKVRYKIFQELGGDKANGATMNMEPLKVLMEYIADPAVTSIAGYPQMIKIYPFMKTLPVGFIHRSKEYGTFITYMGRPLLGYETFPYPMIDLETGKTRYMKATTNEFKREHEMLSPLDVFYK